MSQTTITSHGNSSSTLTTVSVEPVRSKRVPAAQVVDASQPESEVDRAYIERIDELREMARQQHAALDRVIEHHPPRLAGYFLVVFIFGLLMSQWALLSGHPAALLCGLVISVSGLAIVVGSTISRMRHQGKTSGRRNLTQSSLNAAARENTLDHNPRRHSRLQFAVQDSKKASA